MHTKFNSQYRDAMSPIFTSLINEVMKSPLGETLAHSQGMHNNGLLTNISENESGFILETAIPGFDKSEIHVKIEAENLIISTDKKFEEETNLKFLKKEIIKKNFKRVFKLSNTIDKSFIDAKYENGVLTLYLKKITPIVTNVNIK
jgi:HSP20 family protein